MTSKKIDFFRKLILPFVSLQTICLPSDHNFFLKYFFIYSIFLTYLPGAIKMRHFVCALIHKWLIRVKNFEWKNMKLLWYEIR